MWLMESRHEVRLGWVRLSPLRIQYFAQLLVRCRAESLAQALVVKAHRLSKSAKEKIEAAGGRVEVLTFTG